MFDNLFSLISPHHCVVCNSIANGLCSLCKKVIQPANLRACVLCKSELKNYSCRSCELKNIPQFVALNFNDQLRQIIHDYKYNHKRAYAETLAKLMTDTSSNLPQDTVLVPSPTSSKHIRQRGYDHTLNIVRHLAKIHKCDYKPVIHRKTNFRQVGANRRKRFQQAKNAFVCPKILSKSPTYVFFDDVITTGATALAGCQALKLAGASKIQILAITHQTLESG